MTARDTSPPITVATFAAPAGRDRGDADDGGRDRERVSVSTLSRRGVLSLSSEEVGYVVW